MRAHTNRQCAEARHMHQTHTFACGAGTGGCAVCVSKAQKEQVRQVDGLDVLLWSTVPYHPFLDRARPDLACFCASPAMAGGS